jgi:predicted amidohydrolase YtcJ
MKIRHRINNQLTALITSVFLLAACTPELPMTQADLILFNGQIQTVDDSLSVVSAIAFLDGRIVGLGSDKEVRAAFSAKENIDLDGANAYPGLIDPHCHFYGYGLTLRHADLKGTTSWEGVLQKLKEHQAINPTSWVLGRGWDQNDWESKEYPTKAALDSLYPDKPVVLTRIDGHAVIVNQAALDIALIGLNSMIAGGEILQQNGALTGLLIDNAVDSVKNLIPEASYQEKVSALEIAQKNCFAVGLTSVGDAGLRGETIALIDSMQKSGNLRMSVYAMIEGTVSNLDSMLEAGPRKSDFLNVRAVKMYADGALG